MIRPQVNSIGYFTTRKGVVSSRFNRIQTDFDLWYVTAGEGSVKIDGEWIDFKQGDLITIKPGENYQQEKAALDSSFNNYALHLTLFGTADNIIEQQLTVVYPRKLSLVYQPNIATLFEKLLELHVLKQGENLLLQKSIVYSILDIVFEHIRNDNVKNISNKYRRMVKVKDYIEQHYDKDIALNEMATVAGFSFTYFSKLFKLYFNISPTNYHIDYRLKMAKLFLSKGYSVTAASDKCGFHSIHYFSRLFKRRTGISPGTFIKNYIKK
jgi:AraC-like DNA-binding protein